MNALDRFTAAFAPQWTLRRVQARAALEAARSYEAAQGGRRTSGWNRNNGDVNSTINGAGTILRQHARDLVRNNGWARKAERIIVHNTVGWGITPKPTGADDPAAVLATWKAWADSTACDADGLLNFAGLQGLVMKAVYKDGEVLVRRRTRRPQDGHKVPLQIQVLEIDYLDTSRTLPPDVDGNLTINGVVFDKIGRRIGYWLFERHPGALVQAMNAVAKLVPASEILHVFEVDRPGQVRGVSWLGTSIVPLRDLDEFEDAELMRQKIAACFAAFVTDTEGIASSLSPNSTTDSDGTLIDSFEPGMISYLQPGKQVTMASPPTVTDDAFTVRNLRKIAAGLGVTYEDLTGDYSMVNFSSARMGRIVHQANVRAWQNTMLVPQFCTGVWNWVMQAAAIAGAVPASADPIGADWTMPPLPMIEPDKEGLALSRLVRNGTMTFSEMIREQGGDPDTHFEEYAADLKRLDTLKIKLDSDVRAVSQAGLTQERAGGSGGGGAQPTANDSKPGA